MGLETASYVANLVASNPDGGDQRSTADDHIRLIKASLLRTFPLLDGAVSLSSVQYTYLNDLSASVQSQLNQLRDGSATANFAVNSRYANSASVAALIGTIPAARVPDLAAANVFTTTQAIRAAGQVSFQVAGNSGTPGTDSFDLIQDASQAYLWQRANKPLLIGTNGSTRITIAADGAIAIYGAITGTISNATNAANATNATNAANANNAVTAQFATSAGSAALLSGLAPSDVAGTNTIAQRNSSGDLFARYFNQSSSEDEGGAITSLATFQGDNYFRKATLAQLGAQLAAQNITGRTGIAKTLSSSAPSSGGSNGDIWYQYLWLMGIGGVLWHLAQCVA